MIPKRGGVMTLKNSPPWWGHVPDKSQARMRIRQTVTAHDPERLLQMEESALGGLWIDHPSLAFESMPDGSVNVTLKVRPTTRFALAKPLIWLVSLPFGQITPKAMSAFASMIEEAAAQKR